MNDVAPQTRAAKQCGVPTCGNPTETATICTPCRTHLAAQLNRTDWILKHLDDVLSRQTKYGSGAGKIRQSGAVPLAYAVHASELGHELRRTYSKWARTFAGRLSTPQPPRTATESALWLVQHLNKVALHPDAANLSEDVTRLFKRAWIIVDRPVDRWYAGICSVETPAGECDEDLYASRNKGNLTCRKCGHIHDIERRRELLLKHAEDHLATAYEAARAISVLSDEYDRGENKLADRIRRWHDRKRITSRGTVYYLGRPRHLYRIGDILDLLAPKTEGAA